MKSMHIPQPLIGKTGRLRVTFRNRDELHFDVLIKDVKQLFGRTEYLVTPAAGSGACWKSARNVTLLNP